LPAQTAARIFAALEATSVEAAEQVAYVAMTPPQAESSFAKLAISCGTASATSMAAGATVCRRSALIEASTGAPRTDWQCLPA